MNPIQAMKHSLPLVLLLLAATSAGTSTAHCATVGNTEESTLSSTPATEEVRKALEQFYREYAGWIAARFDERPAKPDSPLTDSARRKVEKAAVETGGDPLIRAQDFNKESLPTITVEHVVGPWYAIAYLSTYENRCVVIPVRATVRKGRLEISDITLL